MSVFQIPQREDIKIKFWDNVAAVLQQNKKITGSGSVMLSRVEVVLLLRVPGLDSVL